MGAKMQIELIIAAVCIALSLGMALLSPECPEPLVVLMALALFFVILSPFIAGVLPDVAY